MKTFRQVLTGVALLAMTSAVFAQSSPGLVTGQIPSAAQWNSYFAAKQNVNTTLTGIGAGTINPNPGTFGDATHCVTITGSAGGLITGLSQSTSCPGSAGGVASFNTRTGAVTPQSGDYAVGQVTGAAPLASPTFTGTVTVANGAALGIPATLGLANATGLVPSTGINATGTPSSTTALFGDNSWKSVVIPTAANPTATIGAAAVNGVATTFMRSDAAPPLPSTLPALNGSLLTGMTVSQISGAAPLASPTFTGTVTIPNGGVFGTPTSINLTNAVGLPLTTGVTGILPAANGGNGNGFFAVSGPATSLKTFTFPNASATVLTTNAAVTVAQGGTGIASGTSGGILYFNSTTSTLSSALLAANALVIGGGAGAAPSTTTTGTGILTLLGTPTSANLAAALTDETGTGAAVFASGPTLVAPVLGTPASGNASNLTNIPVANATGILPAANGGAGSVSGIMQANGSGLVAAATLGNGLLYSSPKLSLTNTLNAQTGTSYALSTTDAGAIVTGVNASAQAYTLVVASTSGYTAGYGTTLTNIGTPGTSGNITLTATTSLFGNKATSIVLAPGQVADIGSDGTNYPFTAMSLPVMAQDTLLGNPNASNYPIAMPLPGCASDGTHALTYATHALACTVISGGIGTVTSVATGACLTGGPITSSGTISATYGNRTVSGTTDTIVAGDACGIVKYTSSSAVAVTVPQATGSFASGFSFDVKNSGTNTVTLTPTTSTINGASSLALPAGTSCTIWSDGTNWQIFACTALSARLSGNQTFNGEQDNCITTLTAVSNVFTPDGSCNNYVLTLGATNTLANWSTARPGATGWIRINQDATGGRTVGTYGSQINSPGGTASNTFSAGANAWDTYSYYIFDSTHTWFSPAGLNASH